jgi:multicomponent Na+:H+ antiporter subunit D
MIVPAAVLILLGIAITAVPQLRSVAAMNANSFMHQSSYAGAVLDQSQPAVPIRLPVPPLGSSIVRSAVTGLLALLLALGSVFRDRLGEAVDFTRNLELGNSVLRKLHSGHPGDYVAWLTFGTALLGGMFVWFLR